MMRPCFAVSPIALVVSGGIAASLFTFASTAYAVDTGDAPGSYGVVSHEVVTPSPFLGEVEPDDNDNFADSSAMGDDDDGLDDEGGVFDFPTLVQNRKSYDTNVFATNSLDTAVTLSGWVDFDGNGTFDADEFSTAVVPAGSDNAKFKLEWPSLIGVTTEYEGVTYARFRISSVALLAADATGSAPDGEVEDYSLVIQRDSDGDEIPDEIDPDNDNDGILNTEEGNDVDTDGDGTVNALDVDSDNDTIPDYVEAGENPLVPADTDSDGTPDFLDLDSDDNGVLDADELTDDSDRDGILDSVEGTDDSDADGIANTMDLDSDNDTIPDAIERGTVNTPVDTDQDGIADYLDLDSDNDGITDIREANGNELDVSLVDVDADGRVDNDQLTGVNGLLDRAETMPDTGIPIFAVADSDSDGVRDFRDLDSDNDSVSDLLETRGTDTDSNGLVDGTQDENKDGLIDDANSYQLFGAFPDVDDDAVQDFQDADADGRDQPETEPSDGGEPGDNANPGTAAPGDSAEPVNNNTARIETGLAGGAGCSVNGGRASLAGNKGADVVFPMLLLISLATFMAKRARRKVAYKIKQFGDLPRNR